LESAIAVMLGPGAYTALQEDADGGTGIGLVEVYDNPIDQVTPTPAPGTPTPSATPAATATPSTCVENFDGVTPPALPAGWVASNPIPGDGVGFVTSTTTPDTAPNDVLVPDQDGVSDKVLDRIGVTIQPAWGILTFRNNY